MAATPMQGLHAYFDKQEHSDITIQLKEGRSIAAHKLVLCLSSPVFKVMLEGNFKESAAKVLELPDDDAGAMEELLRFCYGQIHAEMYDTIEERLQKFALAGKYNVRAFSQDCAEKVSVYLKDHWRDPGFPKLVLDIYDSMPKHGGELREAAKEVCRAHLPELMKEQEFKEVMLRSPELGLDLAEMWAEAACKSRTHNHEWWTVPSPAPSEGGWN